MNSSKPNSLHSYEYDLLVIGSGPSGQRAALQAAKIGKKVAIIEQYEHLGGACVHLGTVPSKSFRESVYRFCMSSQGILGGEKNTNIKSAVLPSMSRLLERKNRAVIGESQVIFEQISHNYIKILHGKAHFIDEHTLSIQHSLETPFLVTAQVIIIATGAHPVPPANIQIDGKRVLDSNTILTLERLPKRMVVLGAGIIGCEYASMFSLAGTQVTLVDRRHEILTAVDREIVAQLLERFQQDKVQVELSCEAKQVVAPSDPAQPVLVTLSNGKIIESDVVLLAQARKGNTSSLALSSVGIQPDERGLIKVDSNFRANGKNIYAVGDVVGAPALASTSFEQGRIATAHAFQIKLGGILPNFELPSLYPYGIYTIPEISMIGQTEEEVKQSGVEYVVGKAHYREMARGQIVGDRWGLLKMVVSKKDLKILGVHIIGDSAADLIHIGQSVMILNGDLRYFIQSVFNYPTLAEGYKTAAFHAINQL
jgi:NAD(P) transhydrogenase